MTVFSWSCTSVNNTCSARHAYRARRAHRAHRAHRRHIASADAATTSVCVSASPATPAARRACNAHRRRRTCRHRPLSYHPLSRSAVNDLVQRVRVAAKPASYATLPILLHTPQTILNQTPYRIST